MKESLPFQWMSLPLVSDRTCLVSFNAFEEQHHCYGLPTWKSRIQHPLYFSLHFWLLKGMLQSGRPFTGTQNGLLLLPSCWGFPFLGCFPGHSLMEEEGALHGSGSSLRPRAIAFILRSSLLSAFKCCFMQVALKEAAYKRYGYPWAGVQQQTLKLLSPWERNLLHFARYTSNYSQKGPVCSVSIGQCQYYVDFLAGQPMPELKG